MYSDLDKKSQGGYIIEDALVLTEVFSTAVNIRRGQIFYGRNFGYDFEKYLLRLNEPATLMSIQGDLHRLKSMDGRLVVDPSATKLYTDETDQTVLYIQTMLNVAGLPWVNVEALVEDNNDEINYLSVQDFVGNPDSPWITRSEEENETEGEING